MRCRTDSDSVIRVFESLHPSHRRYILCCIEDIYTRYSALFFVRKLLCKKLWGSLWGKLWGKISRKISRGNAAYFFYLSAFVVIVKARSVSSEPRCRGIHPSSRYSLCPRRRSWRLCQRNVQPRASPPPNCSQLPYSAYKKECKISFCLGLRVLYLSVCNRYECYAVRGSASDYCVPSLRRL